MGMYNISMDNHSVLQAVVTDNDQVIADNLEKFKASLKIPVVGVDYRKQGNGRTILVLCSRTFCLLVSFYIRKPKSVEDFMNDKNICFVAIHPNQDSLVLVGLGNLAARVLKKPSLSECRCLKTVAGEVGVQCRQPPKLANEQEVGNRSGIVFSQDEMEFLVLKAYDTFVMGAKLLGSLEE